MGGTNDLLNKSFLKYLFNYLYNKCRGGKKLTNKASAPLESKRQQSVSKTSVSVIFRQQPSAVSESVSNS